MSIYSKQLPDLTSPRVCADYYQEWITQCWREIPFTQFTPSSQLQFVFKPSSLPRLAGLYAVSAILLPHHLGLPIIHRQGQWLTLADCLPAWVDAQRKSQRFIHLLYIGETDNIYARWSGHEKMIDLRAFQQQGVEMRFYFYSDPPALNPKSGTRTELERTLINSLAPLLNIH
jgi:hypothetical protein